MALGYALHGTFPGSLGATFIGLIITSILYGVTILQCLVYLSSRKDPLYLRGLVLSVVLFDSLHQALICHTVYTYTVTHWGNENQLSMVIWSLIVLSILVNALAAAGDIVIAASLFRLLHAARTGFPSSNKMIDRLVRLNLLPLLFHGVQIISDSGFRHFSR
ncbi:hypothetical protein CVT26_013551 [Gymnopilus dilepis]|uniref:Uncharacterized protein n=1 Tax=Gymnopilus dilepis TaxID=231916 RepID=A0A409X5R7_9AGAR|nr:hypothetical protein CVT26_013551 [Gymnopilus dilepis]